MGVMRLRVAMSASTPKPAATLESSARRRHSQHGLGPDQLFSQRWPCWRLLVRFANVFVFWILWKSTVLMFINLLENTRQIRFFFSPENQHSLHDATKWLPNNYIMSSRPTDITATDTFITSHPLESLMPRTRKSITDSSLPAHVTSNAAMSRPPLSWTRWPLKHEVDNTVNLDVNTWYRTVQRTEAP